MNTDMGFKSSNYSSLGTFTILLYALYGVLIASLYILEGGRGELKSEFFVLFLIISSLFCSTNLSKILLEEALYISHKSILLLFFVYLLIKILIDGNDSENLNLRIIFTALGGQFLAGFIAFTALEARMTVISRAIRYIQSSKGVRWVAMIGTLILLGTTLYTIKQITGTSLLAFQMMFLTNEYYQVFGDFLSIAYCCLISLQMSYFKSVSSNNKRIIIFVILIIVQFILTGVCLQMVNSNKSVLLIAMVSVCFIYYCKPKGWLINDGKIKMSSMFVATLFLSLMGLLVVQLTNEFDVSKLRIFDYGKNVSLIDNSSMQNRWRLVVDESIRQLQIAPFFGDLFITEYQHSSLLSIQTHLGIVGSLLLWSFTIKQVRLIYRDDGNEGLKSISYPVLFVSVISSFFTWGPLWFLLGALYAYDSPETHYYKQKVM